MLKKFVADHTNVDRNSDGANATTYVIVDFVDG
jgi:hypothetical protein